MNNHQAGSETPSLYTILGITPALVESQDDPSLFIRQAYRRALLRHHPDKKTLGSRPSTSTSTSTSTSSSFTVDQICQALALLSDPRSRREYDASLRLPRRTSSEPDGLTAVPAGFQTGLETVDLDDLAFDDSQGRWHRSCRCGNDRGFSFEEDDLIQVEYDGVLMVGCQDCSLWLRVHFAVVQDHEEGR